MDVGGSLELILGNFVYLSGNFAFEKSSDPVMATLTDDSEVEVEVLTLGASDVTGFVGINGPADQDGAMGLSFSGVNVAMMLMKVHNPAAGDERRGGAVARGGNNE